jgi:nifR3 family TIM-barrel protein
MFVKEFYIDDIRIYPNLVLAPMSGVTNPSFRKLISILNPQSVGLFVSEFISIEGLTRNNARSVGMMRTSVVGVPYAVQIFGYDINRMVDAALMVQDQGVDIVDINCGCPVPKVVKRGGGCQLMREPLHLATILNRVKKAISIPLTLKIRAGWDDSSRNALEIAKIAQDNGVSMLAVHGRTRTEGYRGTSDWDLVAEVARSVSIPVVGSGDVVDEASAQAGFDAGVSALMIGRRALSNPWIFKDLCRCFEKENFRPEVESETAIVEVLKTYRDLLLQDMPERAVTGRL